MADTAAAASSTTAPQTNPRAAAQPQGKMWSDAGRWMKTALNNFFTGNARDIANDHHDPLLDVVRQYPDEAIWFIRVVMFFGSVSGVLISIPCTVFLFSYWTPCGACNRPLRYWVVLHCMLQMLQAPVRLIFYFRLSAIQREHQNNVRELVRQLTYSPAWRISKTISIITYGWFILGVVWILNSTYCPECPGLYRLSLAVIFTAVARLLVTLVCFYHSFPPRLKTHCQFKICRCKWQKFQFQFLLRVVVLFF